MLTQGTNYYRIQKLLNQHFETVGIPHLFRNVLIPRDAGRLAVMPTPHAYHKRGRGKTDISFHHFTACADSKRLE